MIMKKVSILTLASVIMFNGIARADQGEALGNLITKTQAVQEACGGIKHNLDTIFGLSVATTVSSGLGTVAAGAALTTGIVKSVKDKKIEENESSQEDLLNKIREYADTKDETKKQQAISAFDKLKAEIEENEKKTKLLGNVRTGLMAGATVTSAVSLGTSIGATVNAKKLAEKMSECNKAVGELKLAKATAEAEEISIEASAMVKANAIISACTGYDESNISALKKLSTANAIISGVGTATAGAGTATSLMANTNKTRAEGGKKEKGLNLASNILAGVTAGTSGTSTTLSAIQIKKAKKDSDMAEKCEAAL